MSCDIHAHIEIKVNGRWEHYSFLQMRRNYLLFAKIAGVRKNGGVEPIAPPRGVPADVSVTAELDFAYHDIDYHSHTWLTLEELLAVEKWWEEEGFDAGVFGYLFGHDWDEFRSFGVEDVRIVCAFDS